MSDTSSPPTTNRCAHRTGPCIDGTQAEKVCGLPAVGTNSADQPMCGRHWRPPTEADQQRQDQEANDAAYAFLDEPTITSCSDNRDAQAQLHGAVGLATRLPPPSPRQQLAYRLTDFRRYLDSDDPYGDDDPDSSLMQELGPVHEYGLDWALAISDHRAGTVTYVHVLSTGGPHEEFQVTFDEERAGYVQVSAVTFVSLPWFGRVEIPLTGDEMETAREFYDRFYVDGSVSTDSLIGDEDR